MDTLSSLCSGLTNVIRDVLGLTIIILSYDFMVDNLALFKIKTTRPKTFRFVAGEFVMVSLPEGTPSRAYSICSGPYDDELEF